MKRNILLFAFTLAAANVFAFATTDLHLKTFDNAPVTVQVDGFTYQSADNKLLIEGLKSGQHQLRVFKSYNGYGNYYPQLVSIFDGTISLTPNTEIFAVISGVNSLQIKQVIYKAPVYEPPCYDPNENYYYHPDYHYVMSNENFYSLRQTVDNLWFDSSREDAVKQAIDQNYFTSAQVKDLLGLFSFESSKLDIAKYAYAKVIDPQNYFVVDNAFSFESSIGELQSFISHH